MRKTFLLFVVLFGISATTFAQEISVDGQRISGLFPGISFQRFASQIESKTEFRFFFDEKALSDIQVNISAKDNTLSQILTGVFDGTDFKFFVDERKRVFITNGTPLDNSLNPEFFKTLEDQQVLDSLQRQKDIDRVYSRNKLYILGETNPSKTGTATLRGNITSLENGSPVNGAIVFEKVNYTRAISNDKGNYEIKLPTGRHVLFIQNLGGFVEQRQINLVGDGILDISIEENIISLSEVTISSEKMSNIGRPEMGVQKLNIASMKKIPAVLGEVDVIRSILTLPGVQTVGEASVGFNVRGGAADQNLILYNHSTIYNPSHLFGLFSAFNPDLVESVDLYKAGVPVKYGGRLSSVLNVNGKYGNSDKVTVRGGIGLLTGRLSVDGPLGPNTTFSLGARSTYSDWLLKILEENTDFQNGAANFYDFDLHFAQKIGQKDVIRFNGYGSRDRFRFDPDTTFQYQNQNFNLGWTHYFNDKLEMEVVLGRDSYQFDIEGRDNPANAYNFGFDIKQNFAKANFRYELDEQHTLQFGINTVQYQLSPGSIAPEGPESIVIPKTLNQERAFETAIFVGDDFEVNDKLTVNYGGRYVFYSFIGPNTINIYQEGVPRTPASLIGERAYGPGERIQSYSGPEFRISGRYAINNFSSVKFGYNTNRQFIHLLTNNAAIAPTDVWKLSDPHIKPQWGDQVSLGYYRNFDVDKYEFSVEAYHRNMRNLIDFRSGSVLILNEALEQSVLNTDGRAYGAEFLLRKNQGKLSGWVSYTYSRSLLRTAADETAEKINDGNWYPNNFDQPHNVVLVTNYAWSRRFSTSLLGNYSTGRPITLPVAKFNYGGTERVYFSDRNAYRIPDYFRLDFSMNIEGNHKVRKLAHSSWSVGVYNLLGRRNPYSVYFTPVNGVLKGYQLSIFAEPIPFITYNFRF